MATNLRRFTVSINQDMELDLDEAKKETYYRETQSEMIRDLIIRGLASLKVDNPTYSNFKRGEKIMKKTRKTAIVVMLMGIMSTANVVFAAPLADYSAGKTAIDLSWRSSDVKTSGTDDAGSWETSFGKKYNLDWGITTGIGNNFAVQYNGYNAKSKDAVSWSDANETGISHLKLKTQEFNVLYKLNKNVSVYTGLVRLKGQENANITYTDGSPSESESYTTNSKNKIQFGIIGSTKLAEKTTAYAQVGVASNFTNWKIGVSQELTPNFEFNVDYRGLKAKKLEFVSEGEQFEATSKGFGFGVTCKF